MIASLLVGVRGCLGIGWRDSAVLFIFCIVLCVTLCVNMLTWGDQSQRQTAWLWSPARHSGELLVSQVGNTVWGIKVSSPLSHTVNGLSPPKQRYLHHKQLWGFFISLVTVPIQYCIRAIVWFTYVVYYILWVGKERTVYSKSIRHILQERCNLLYNIKILQSRFFSGIIHF